ncbi:hypothetical protein [Brasilonema sp. UFV-L1]|uniref:hypothetical protein n=1 Tax=Brasilonema sp. UFV-L1 TaxID=2234130 RepID=UPI00145E0E58|nr:hypothetical protein [Brasilonema sp. UFV-L1]
MSNHDEMAYFSPTTIILHTKVSQHQWIEILVGMTIVRRSIESKHRLNAQL